MRLYTNFYVLPVTDSSSIRRRSRPAERPERGRRAPLMHFVPLLCNLSRRRCVRHLVAAAGVPLCCVSSADALVVILSPGDATIVASWSMRSDLSAGQGGCCWCRWCRPWECRNSSTRDCSSIPSRRPSSCGRMNYVGMVYDFEAIYYRPRQWRERLLDIVNGVDYKGAISLWLQRSPASIAYLNWTSNNIRVPHTQVCDTSPYRVYFQTVEPKHVVLLINASYTWSGELFKNAVSSFNEEFRVA
jgi:hypothetical protein